MKVKSEIDDCEMKKTNKHIVDDITRSMPDDDTLLLVSELFKVFGDFTRTKIISALMQKELCVDVLSETVKMSKSAVSHQLRILRQTKLVKYRKSGKEVIYSIDDEHISKLYQMAVEHIKE